MQKFSTIAEWIDAGNLKTGWYVVTPTRESEKAFATRCYKYSQAGNPYTTEAWFPKKLCMMVLNNFYTEDMGNMLWLVPEWLYRQKLDEGCTFL
ncbi:MAG: hypothetical protein KDC71_23845 [Acidobacteria bacterium]|nr:hypothetical protein [Acidobacteriota bacterium]